MRTPGRKLSEVIKGWRADGKKIDCPRMSGVFNFIYFIFDLCRVKTIPDQKQ